MFEFPNFPRLGQQIITGLTESTAARPVTRDIMRVLQQLPSGELLKGVVLQNNNGHVNLKTEIGQLQLTSSLPLKSGDDLVLRVLSGGKNFQAELVTINKQPATTVFASEINASTINKPSSANVANSHSLIFRLDDVMGAVNNKTQTENAANNKLNINQQNADANNQQKHTHSAPIDPSIRPTNISQGSVVTAILLEPKPAAMSGLVQQFGEIVKENIAPKHIISGTIITTKLISHSVARDANIGSQINNATSIKVTAPDVITKTNNIATQKIDTAIPETKPQQVGVMPKANNAPLTKNLTFTATIISNTDISNIAKTPYGTVAINSETIIPKGTELILEITNITLPTSVPNIAPLPETQIKKDAIIQIMRQWSALEQLVEAVKSEPVIANKLLKEIIPQADKNLGNDIMKFIAAIKTGEITQWLSPSVMQWLKDTNRTELLERLTKDFSAHKNPLTEPNPSGWHALFFPLFDGDELNHVRFFVRDQEQENNDAEKPGSRFIVEVSLSALGDMQIDGLITHKANQQFLNLIIRAKFTLDLAIKNNIMTIFDDAINATNLKGKLSFQQVKDFPINPEQEMLGGEGDSTLLV